MLGDVGGLHGLHHGSGFCRGAAERLFAQHHFARLGGGNGYLCVGVVGAGYVDEIDVGTLHECAPVTLYGLVAPVISKRFGSIGVAGADGFENGPIRQIEKVRRLQERVGVGAAHETVTDEADVQFLFSHGARSIPPVSISYVDECF